MTGLGTTVANLGIGGYSFSPYCPSPARVFFFSSSFLLSFPILFSWEPSPRQYEHNTKHRLVFVYIHTLLYRNPPTSIRMACRLVSTQPSLGAIRVNTGRFGIFFFCSWACFCSLFSVVCILGRWAHSRMAITIVYDVFYLCLKFVTSPKLSSELCVHSTWAHIYYILALFPSTKSKHNEVKHE